MGGRESVCFGAVAPTFHRSFAERVGRRGRGTKEAPQLTFRVLEVRCFISHRTLRRRRSARHRKDGGDAGDCEGETERDGQRRPRTESSHSLNDAPRPISD
jgi:hypothetical protein